jgi:hypothetical protein
MERKEKAKEMGQIFPEKQNAFAIKEETLDREAKRFRYGRNVGQRSLPLWKKCWTENTNASAMEEMLDRDRFRYGRIVGQRIQTLPLWKKR